MLVILSIPLHHRQLNLGFHQVGIQRHDLLDVFVGRGSLIEAVLEHVMDDAFSSLFEQQSLQVLYAAHAAAGAVRAAHERVGIVQALDDVLLYAHRSGDDTRLDFEGAGGSFAVNAYVLDKVKKRPRVTGFCHSKHPRVTIQ